MTRRTGQRQAGFTLIELLVVITIIAVLLSLILAAVNKVRGVGPRAATTSQMSAIGNAIGTYKGSASFGNAKYIPPGAFYILPGGTSATWNAFRLRDTYPPAGTASLGEPDINSFEAQYIIQIFGVRPLPMTGGIGISTLGFPTLGKPNLDANQTLTFFLAGIPVVSGTSPNLSCVFTGFSANSQAPFTPRVNPTDTRRTINFDPSGGSPRGYAVDPQNGFPRLVDGWGRPFAYFAALNGQANAYTGTAPFFGGFNPSSSTTYISGTGPVGVYPPGPTALLQTGLQPYQYNSQFANPSGYQLISAGEDGAFGLSGNWAAVDPAGKDDRVNFSTSNLGAGPP